ncbi:uncharacterized protein LOC144118837 isoform X2 [Amblyomma americanum]
MRRNDSYLEYAANLDRGKIKKLPLIRGDPADEATKLIMKTVVKTPVAHMYTLKGRGEKEAFKNLRLYCEIVEYQQPTWKSTTEWLRSCGGRETRMAVGKFG